MEGVNGLRVNPNPNPISVNGSKLIFKLVYPVSQHLFVDAKARVGGVVGRVLDNVDALSRRTHRRSEGASSSAGARKGVMVKSAMQS